jgi:hypothetical protein
MKPFIGRHFSVVFSVGHAAAYLQFFQNRQVIRLQIAVDPSNEMVFHLPRSGRDVGVRTGGHQQSAMPAIIGNDLLDESLGQIVSECLGLGNIPVFEKTVIGGRKTQIGR